MKCNNSITTLIICSLLPITIFCQKKDIDSFRIILAAEKEGLSKVNALNELSYSLYFNGDYAEALQNAQEALAMSERLNYLKGKGFANINIGCYYLDKWNLAEAEKFFTTAQEIAQKANDKRLTGFNFHALGGLYFAKSDFTKALEKYKEAINLYKAVNDTKLVAHIERIFGILYSFQGNHAEALKHSLIALKYFEEVTDEDKIATTYSNIGICYSGQSNYSEAIKNFYLALKHFKDSTNKNGIQSTLQQISGIYYWQGKYDEAIEIQKQCLKMCKAIGDEFLIAQSYMSIGNMIIEKGKLVEGLEYFISAQKIYDNMKDPGWGLGWCYNSIGDAFEKRGDSARRAGNLSNGILNYIEAEKNYNMAIKAIQPDKHQGVESEAYILLGKVSIKLKKYAEANRYLHKGLAIAKEILNRENIRMAYQNLSVFDSVTSNFKQAYADYKMYILYRDSILSEESIRKSEGYKMQFDFEKKEDSLKRIHVITETKLQTQKKQKYFYWAGLIMLTLLSFFVFTNFRKQKKINWLAAEAHDKQKAETEFQNLQAMDNERLRISSDLHDEVGATLSGIAMYSHLAKEQIKNSQAGAIEKSLSIIQSNAGEMVNKLNDIVWLINPGQDSLQKLMQRLEDYAIQIAAVKNIRVKSNLNGHHSANILPAETRRNIYLLFKEAINNAVKYSHATLLELYVKEQDGGIEISLKDDGDGFDMERVRRGNGLSNMEQRAKEMKANYTIDSRKEKGTSITVTI